MWTQQEAIELLKRLEPDLAKVGFHCALGGSVLYRGTSEKDLDVIIYPHTYKKQSPPNNSIAEVVLKLFFQAEKIKACGGESSSQERDDKEVKWLTTEGNKRVDFFFLK